MVFAEAAVNTVFVATRHDSHGRYVLKALRAGKHVFVEKPLCLTQEELQEIEELTGGESAVRRQLMVAVRCMCLLISMCCVRRLDRSLWRFEWGIIRGRSMRISR